jgi:hypothetical protein
VNPEIDADGVVRWRDADGIAHVWASLAELAADWWRYQRLSAREKESDPMTAWDCVVDSTDAFEPLHPRALDVIQALVDGAQDEADDVGLVGAGPLEELLNGEHSAEFVDDIERRARQHPRFRKAVSGIWMGEEVPREIRHRLAEFGATDLTT